MGLKPNQDLVQFQISVIQLFLALGSSSDHLSAEEVRELFKIVGVLAILEVIHVTATFKNYGSNLHDTEFGKSNTSTM